MISIKVNGLESALKSLSTKEYAARMQKAFTDYGQNVVRDAKQECPVDEGHLRNSISYKLGPAGVTIIASAEYAGYIEFGTRKFAASYVASLPADWQAFAATLKGPGTGTFEQMVEDLVRWVAKKGIGATYNVKTRRRDRQGKQTAATTDYATAYAIARMILINGIRPHPFIYPAVTGKNMQVLEKQIKDIAND